jgi:arsenate reductase (thioredoxin)
MDFVITVCDNAANEACPIWLGHPSIAHWGFPDPASIEGTDLIKREAFQKTLLGLKKNIEALIRSTYRSTRFILFKESYSRYP